MGTTASPAITMYTETLGAGTTIIFVHGGADGGRAAFGAQVPLADRWRLVLPDRPGHGRTPSYGRSDFERDAHLIAELAGSQPEGAHLVGHSYGGVVALLAAAAAPSSTRSLTVIEPPAFSVATGVPVVDAMAEANKELFTHPPQDPRELLRRFFAMGGIPGDVPDPLPEPMLRAAQRFLQVRGPWEAQIPVEELRRAGFPKLIVTGGRTPGFEAIGDALAEQLAGQRAIVPAGHAVQATGDPFNTVLEAFLSAAEDK